jgi:hypothetical protein
MISEELSIPESVADFMEGRVLKKVGARHYTKSLRHRLRRKVRVLRQDLRLLEEAGFVKVANNRNRVAEISDHKKIPDQGSFSNRGAFLVRSPGFEPGSSAWEADVLAKLDYDRSYFRSGSLGEAFSLRRQWLG